MLAGHEGVIVAGDARWLDRRVARALRNFVRDGAACSPSAPVVAAQHHPDARGSRDRPDAAGPARPVRCPAAAGRSASGDWVEVELDLGDGPSGTAARPTRCPSGPAWAGYLIRVTWTRRTTSGSSIRRSSGTGWARTRRGRTTPAASTCTSAAWSTRCRTCCTRGSGTRSCTTWATLELGGAVPQAGQPGLHPGLRLHRRPRHLRAGGGGRRGRRRWFHVERPAGPSGVREDGQVAEERGDSRRDVRALRRRHLPPVRDVDGPAGCPPALVHPRRGRFGRPPAARLAQSGGRADRRDPGHRRRAGHRDAAGPAPGDRRRARRLRGAALQHGGGEADRAEQPPDQGLRRRPACPAPSRSPWC